MNLTYLNFESLQITFFLKIEVRKFFHCITNLEKNDRHLEVVLVLRGIKLLL